METALPPRVSIVIANYNGERYLAAAVKSALQQSISDIEILIADDLSNDGSPAIALALAANDPRVHFIASTRNSGPAGARNRAIAQARGDWIAIFDNDDLMHPLRIETLIEAADRYCADIVSDDLLVFDNQLGSEAKRFLEHPEADGPFELTPLRYFSQTVMYGKKPNLGFLKPIIRHSALKAARLRYDERLRIAEDDDLIIRALAAGLRYWVIPTLTYFYRKHAQSISHRTSIADLEAMVAASSRIDRLFPSADAATRRAIAQRSAATQDAAAFEHFLDAARKRDALTAVRVLWTRKSAAQLLRLPLAARFRRLKPRPQLSTKQFGRHVLIVSRQRIVGRTNGSSTYLLDIASAIREAGMLPHLLQPSPSITGRRPILRLGNDLSIFETHRIRGVWKWGSFVVSRDFRVWKDASQAIIARIAKRFGIRLSLPDTPYPHTITVPWNDDDRLFVAQQGRQHADAILIDYVFQAEAIPMLMRPEAQSAIVMHDLFVQRANSFGSAANRDSVDIIDENQEARLMSRADAVVAIQSQEAEWVARHVPTVSVFTAPMAAHPVPVAQPGDDRTVLFVGSNTSPNVIAIEWILESLWERVRSAIPDAQLIIAGSVSAAFSSVTTPGIKFCGVVPDLEPLYRQAGVVISPLTVGSGLKIKLIDAIARGKAIVATSVTLQGVEAEIGSSVICTNDDATFANAIITLLKDPAERLKRAELALEVARTDFSPQRCYGAVTDWLAGSPKLNEPLS
ncbi:glycosyltransferase [Novosphingobium terrae]|uniref:glycosyltransferase n=1 Tax=Novosphingobium terrae TaxID=2726189 RepID=UPI00197E98D2|nr:glycosyltransferase [Novosphingobium terrae]